MDLNPKHEIRNSKQFQMTKFQIYETNDFKTLEFQKFEFVLRQAQDGEQSRTISDWSGTDASPDIRISDFSTTNSIQLWSTLEQITQRQ